MKRCGIASGSRCAKWNFDPWGRHGASGVWRLYRRSIWKTLLPRSRYVSCPLKAIEEKEHFISKPSQSLSSLTCSSAVTCPAPWSLTQPFAPVLCGLLGQLTPAGSSTPSMFSSSAGKLLGQVPLVSQTRQLSTWILELFFSNILHLGDCRRQADHSTTHGGWAPLWDASGVFLRLHPLGHWCGALSSLSSVAW